MTLEARLGQLVFWLVVGFMLAPKVAHFAILITLCLAIVGIGIVAFKILLSVLRRRL